MASNIELSELSKTVTHDRLGKSFAQFSNGDRGRHLLIELINSEVGNEELIQDALLIEIVSEFFWKSYH